jgi:hypothetical protein
MFALPSLKPPAFTFLVVWHPEPLQSRLPIGMWFAGVVTIVTLRKVLATFEPWQVRQPVMPWCTPVTE